MGKHRAEPRKTSLKNELRWLRENWSYFRYHRRNRRHPWAVDLVIRIAKPTGKK